MEILQKDKILLFNEDTMQAVQKCFNLDKPGVMKDAVHILEKWVKEQTHFTKKDFERRYLETTIIASKGSIEKAKTRLDRSCTYRTLNPDLFQIYDIRHFYKTDLKEVSHAILPKMTKNHERVYILRNVGKKFESTIMTSFIRSIPSFVEYVRRHDYSNGFYVVLDYMDTNLTDLTSKITVSDVQRAVTYLLDCCGFRLKSLYFISSSKLIEVGVAICRQVISKKLFERVHVLKDRASLQKVIDIEMLPKEYGGNGRSLEELHEEWLDILTSQDHMEYLREINSARTDESLRQKDTFNDQYIGMPGTFRTLCVD